MAPSRARNRHADDGHSERSAPRIQDVARRAGVAIGTVSNVLNNPGLVAEQTRLKVEAAIAELGFVRNSAARALAARRTDTWAVISLPPTSSIEEHASWSSSPAVRICD